MSKTQQTRVALLALLALAATLLVLYLTRLLVDVLETVRGDVMDTVRKYADQSGLNGFFEPLEEDLEKMMLGLGNEPGEYLGETQDNDPKDPPPLTGADDPDLDEKLQAEQDAAGPAEDEAKQEADAAAELKSEFLGEEVDGNGVLKSVPVPLLPHKEYADVAAPDAAPARQPLRFRLYSHNIKNGAHGKLVIGETPWETRRLSVLNSIRLHAVANTVVLLQEALQFQLNDVLEQLNLFAPKDSPEWVSYGVGRMDGQTKGEYVPILVRPAEWDVVHDNTMWLNEVDTHKGLVGWDAKYPRIATYVTLKHRQSGAYINVFNSHFDHKGKQAREESARLLMAKMGEINAWPSFLCGDLNAVPKDNSYKQLVKAYADVHTLAGTYNRYGHPEYSVTGFLGKYLKDAKRIDYVFAPDYTKRLSEQTCKAVEGRPFFVQLQGYGLLHSKFGGLYMSDHRPVVADFLLGTCPK